MRRAVIGTLKRVLKALGYGLVGSFVAITVVYVSYLERRPDLSIWHLADLDAEFTAGSDVPDFEAYLALEERLFKQLDDKVYAQVGTGPEFQANRYSRGSLSDPSRWPINGNRSFQLRRNAPDASVLLIHGLSDSPYSLRALGERLYKAGSWVTGLRVPGHGTAPSGLVKTRWQDMAAAVNLAARHTGNAAAGKPFFIVGYSNGGALAIEYALSALEDASLPQPSGIVLLSPAIGVSGLAAFAVWQARLGHLLGFEKLAWESIVPEYDPFKYGSFAVNAGDLVYRLTLHLRKRLETMRKSGKLEEMPRILAFQSAVDATVSAPALVQHLFDRLPPRDHELVLFDINRASITEPLLAKEPRTEFEPLLAVPNRGFDLTVITNVSDGSNRLVARHSPQGSENVSERLLPHRWPPDIYSLSHVALPFPPGDPVYGGPDATESLGIQLGNLALRGERNTLRVSGTDMLRLRWNPFYPYVEERILNFLKTK